jgi:hypothetical protein
MLYSKPVFVKILRRPGIYSQAGEEESIPGLLKRFTNTGSETF